MAMARKMAMVSKDNSDNFFQARASRILLVQVFCWRNIYLKNRASKI
jgi:hypothetical protein